MKILSITAHPDDEAANFGGTIRRYADRGIEARLICLTAGEAARNRGTAGSADELKRLRRAELAASCRVLGFASHEVWDLPDAGLPQAPFYPAVGRLVGEIRSFRPDLLLCMGPEGSATAHPDHAMSGVLATAAFHWAAHERYFPELQLAAHQARRLFYATTPRQPPGFPPVWLPLPDVAIAVDVEVKIAAFRCHTTQAPLFERVEGFLRTAGGGEMFHLAAGVALPDSGACDDLWSGLK